jgi:Uma2 family endonuclease
MGIPVRSAAMVNLVTPDDGVRLRGLRREEYERLVDTGVLDGQAVELLGGELIEVSPQGPSHEYVIAALTRQLSRLLAEGYDLRVQLSLRVDDASLPEPDLAVTDHVVRGDRPASAHLVIEVSVTSQRIDLLHKAPRYASAGVTTYVVLDLPAHRAVVHTNPTADGYASLVALGPDDRLEVLGVPLDLGELLR